MFLLAAGSCARPLTAFEPEAAIPQARGILPYARDLSRPPERNSCAKVVGRLHLWKRDRAVPPLYEARVERDESDGFDERKYGGGESRALHYPAIPLAHTVGPHRSTRAVASIE